MLAPVLTVRIQSDHSLVMLRDRCRQVGELFGLDTLQRTRLTTAVSEIGRNALQHAGGAAVHFLVGDGSRPKARAVVVRVVDKGPGIPASVWNQGALDAGQRTTGLEGSQRLVDAFWIETSPEAGTSVNLEMHLRRDIALLSAKEMEKKVDELIRRKPQSPREELEHQNREMLHTLEQLRLRQGELEQADRRKDEFVAMLAHELRNPLSAITMTVELLRLRSDASAQELKRYADTIDRQASHLTKLVDDLMDVSRVSRGKVVLEREVIEVDFLVGQAVEMTRAFLDAKNQKLIVSVPAERAYVDVDVVRMKQVLSNLIHNSARYSPEGALVEVSAAADGRSVAIAVRDNGIGIDPEMLPKVFDLFAQASTGLARQGSGLGVGLTIVQRLVHDHGGTVTASSRGLGLGSEFVVTLSTVPPVVRSVQAPPAAPPPASPLRVLVVDDNADAADAICEILRLDGYDCVVAKDGLEALEAAGRGRPDLAVVDIGLPLLDGFGVVRELRKRHGVGMSIVAMSGYSTPAMKARAADAGFDAFLVKPVEMPLVVQRLRTIQEKKRLAEGPGVGDA